MSEMLQLIALSALAWVVVLFLILTIWTPQVIEWSVQFYRLLLGVYPASFREEYGAAMVQLYRDTARDAYRRNRLFGLPSLWLRMLVDLTISVLRQHRDKPVTRSNEPALLREFVQKWQRLGFDAVSVTAFSAWYFLHHFWAILTVITFAAWFASFFDSVDLVRGSNKATTVDIVSGLAEIQHRYERKQPIREERFWRQAKDWENLYPWKAIEINKRLNQYPYPWEINFVSDIHEGRSIGAGLGGKGQLIQPCKSWRLRFHFGFFPLLLLAWTIRVYRRRKASPAAAMQSA